MEYIHTELRQFSINAPLRADGRPDLVRTLGLAIYHPLR